MVGKMFYFLLDVARVNGYLLYKEGIHLPPARTLAHKEFTVMLGEELIAGYSRPTDADTNITARPVSLANVAGHRLVKGTRRGRLYRQCIATGRCTVSGRYKESTYKCDTCGVYLCRDGCYLAWHSA